MGLLKNIATNAVRDGIRKGVGNAIGKAVEQAVAPAAERWANKSAQAIDSAAEQMNKSINETKTAISEAGAETKTAVAEANAATQQAKTSLGGLAGLESALAGFASKAEQYATKMSASMKVCPNCGQPSPADKAFCPNCGTKLPETTLGQDYTCSKCGAVNTPGTKYCSSCGALLPGAEAEMKAQKAKDEAVIEKLASLLPQYPKWTAGGKEFNLEECGTRNGYPEYGLSYRGGRVEVNAYISTLLANGFQKLGCEYWKTVDGVCRVFQSYDEQDDGTICVGFYVSDCEKRAQPKSVEDPLADLKGAAKGLFKKYF